MTAAPEDWAASMRRIGEEAAGVVTLDVVRRCDMPGLLAEALAGDVEAFWLLGTVRHCLTLIRNAPAQAPMECGCCCKPLRNSRFAIGVVRPGTADPAHGLTLAICLRCGPTVGAIQAAAGTGLRQLWPDLRLVAVTHPEGGRA